jgi:hypothetical protein
MRSLLLEPLQRGIQRAERDLEDSLRNLLDALRDPVAVERLERERLQDQQLQLFGGYALLSVSIDGRLISKSIQR